VPIIPDLTGSTVDPQHWLTGLFLNYYLAEIVNSAYMNSTICDKNSFKRFFIL
jgi:hypothetical protein